MGIPPLFFSKFSGEMPAHVCQIMYDELGGLSWLQGAVHLFIE